MLAHAPKSSVGYLSALAAATGAVAMTLRPTVFGEIASFPIAAALVGLTVGLLLLCLRRVYAQELVNVAPQAVLFALLIIYTSARGVMAGGVAAENAVKGLLVGLAGVLAVVSANSSSVTRRGFYDGAAIIIIAASLSVLATRILLSAGLSAHDLHLIKIEYTYPGRGDVLFPFTFAHNNVQSPFGVQPRLNGLFREPGILPAFACWAAAYACFKKWPTWVWIATLLGAAASFSSLGLPLAIYTGSFLFARRMKISLPAAALAGGAGALVAWPFLYSLNDIGLGSKISSDSISFRERLYMIETAFSARDTLFGDGVGSIYRANEGISLISQTRIFGMLFFAAATFTYAISGRRPHFFVVGLVPLAVTILFSQPISLDVLTMVAFTSWTALEPEATASPHRRSNSLYRYRSIGNAAG